MIATIDLLQSMKDTFKTKLASAVEYLTKQIQDITQRMAGLEGCMDEVEDALKEEKAKMEEQKS